MIDSITRLTLNLQETGSMVSVRAKRGDTGRKLRIHLSDGSLPYPISKDCYAVFTAKKPDGKCIHNSCTIDNNVIEYAFTEQTCAAVGTLKAEIRLYGADDKMITSACFLLKSSEATRARYPFDFELRIRYELNNASLHISWHVRNLSGCEMPFTIGGHPAFSLDSCKEDYCLCFPGRDSLQYLLLDPASGTAVADKVYTIALENECLPLTEEMFAHDALILDGGQVQEVWLCEKGGQKRIGMTCPGFPNYGIWSVQGAPFVCLEPWMGRCDDAGFSGDFSEKENVNILNAGETFEQKYSVVLP